MRRLRRAPEGLLTGAARTMMATGEQTRKVLPLTLERVRMARSQTATFKIQRSITGCGTPPQHLPQPNMESLPLPQTQLGFFQVTIRLGMSPPSICLTFRTIRLAYFGDLSALALPGMAPVHFTILL